MVPKFLRKKKLKFKSKYLFHRFAIDQDKNELFIIKKCSLYLYRYLCGRFFLDKDTMEFVCWVLGDDKNLIADYLIEFFNDEEKKEIKHELLECLTDNDDFARVLIRSLMRIKSFHHNKFRQLVLNLIQNKHLQAKYRGLSDVEKSILKIKKMFDLSENEIEFCILFYILKSGGPPETFFDNHLDCDRFPGRKHLKNILGINQSSFNELCTGVLGKAGMLKIDHYNISLDDDFLFMLQSSPRQIISKKFYSKVSGNTIPLDYHLNNDKEINHVLQLLQKKSSVPTHILLYGPPGTGKTSFSYGLAKKLGIPAFEIARGEDNKSVNRRAALLACLNMTNSGNGSIVIVDEADNVLNTISSWFMRGETQDKGWLNHLLEEPDIRMIWITNSIKGIENSVLRRFAFSIQFKPFSLPQRVQLWDNIARRNKCRSFFKNSDINQLIKKFKVSPGAIDLAVKKAKQLCPSNKDEFLKAVHFGLEAHQTLNNYGEKPVFKNQIETSYSLDGLNISGDMDALIFQIERFDQYMRHQKNDDIKNLNLLFYGPPGTGKSELARYLAGHLDKELICKRLSDILDPYVGVAEKNIRRAFEEAERDEAILIIDEADSLLHPREKAVRSWEINFTNEFLTQMERFKGILICTTNHLKSLDMASIRRFNQKIGFDFLEPDGNIIFYKKLLAPLINSPIQETSTNLLSRISDLAPGDFKIVRDRYAFYPEEELCHELLIQSLAEESKIKNNQQGLKTIGF